MTHSKGISSIRRPYTYIIKSKILLKRNSCHPKKMIRHRDDELQCKMCRLQEDEFPCTEGPHGQV